MVRGPVGLLQVLMDFPEPEAADAFSRLVGQFQVDGQGQFERGDGLERLLLVQELLAKGVEPGSDIFLLLGGPVFCRFGKGQGGLVLFQGQLELVGGGMQFGDFYQQPALRNRLVLLPGELEGILVAEEGFAVVSLSLMDLGHKVQAGSLPAQVADLLQDAAGLAVVLQSRIETSELLMGEAD